ncbi:MAG: hypothetical protein AB7U51_09915 [Arcobacter sp.]|uniref:hypothetical protein n=1 Tax=Arcobacter sp. TaxID=1872629 RepID=UPI0025848A91|nr:hypothetical protein [Arcobacter sp.]MDD3008684.1 hypothetical protein [Arcobacter sp.]
MKKNILIAGSILSATFLFTGCATILSGDNQSINLQSKKEQTVSINGQQYTSPNVISLERTDKDAVLKVKDCEKQILLKKEINPVFFVNILSGGVFGSTTDYASDSMWQYDQTNVNVDCE